MSEEKTPWTPFECISVIAMGIVFGWPLIGGFMLWGTELMLGALFCVGIGIVMGGIPGVIIYGGLVMAYWAMLIGG